MSCAVRPNATEGAAGVTAMAVKVAAVTVNVVELEIAPDVAEMVVGPVVKVEARPALLMVALAGADDAHATDPVKSVVEPSE